MPHYQGVGEEVSSLVPRGLKIRLPRASRTTSCRFDRGIFYRLQGVDFRGNRTEVMLIG